MIRRIEKDNKIIFVAPMKVEIDLDALNLLATGEHRNLCRCQYNAVDKRHNLIYEFNKEMFQNIKSQRMSYTDVCRLLNVTIELINYLQEKEMYLKNVQLKPIDICFGGNEFEFVYLPLKQKDDISPKEFCLKLIHCIHSNEQNVIALTKKLKTLETYQVIEDFVKNLNLKDEDEMSTEKAFSVYESEGETTLLAQPEDEEEESSEGETTLLQQHTTAFFTDKLAECETTVLSDVVEPKSFEQSVTYHSEKYDLFLLRNSSGEKIHINKPVFLIGKDLNEMDYVLGSESVSRNHATIYLEEESCYISDNGSTNGTTIEGIKLQNGEKAELDDGYIVSLGREVFQVLMERKEL